MAADPQTPRAKAFSGVSRRRHANPHTAMQMSSHEPTRNSGVGLSMSCRKLNATIGESETKKVALFRFWNCASAARTASRSYCARSDILAEERRERRQRKCQFGNSTTAESGPARHAILSLV
jgi:hypothetical protein